MINDVCNNCKNYLICENKHYNIEKPCDFYMEEKKGKWIRLNNTSTRSYKRVCNKCNKISYFCGEGNYPNCPYCLAEMEADNEN